MARYEVQLSGVPGDGRGAPAVRRYRTRARHPSIAVNYAVSRAYDDGVRSFDRPPTILRRRRLRRAVPVGSARLAGWLGPWADGDDGDDGGEPGGGLAGVREPRRPKPAPPSLSMELPEPR